jgi:hypothetical protein
LRVEWVLRQILKRTGRQIRKVKIEDDEPLVAYAAVPVSKP